MTARRVAPPPGSSAGERTDRVRVALGARRSRRLPSWMRMAAVAVVLREGEQGLELLFVRRPVRRGDRWSGDVAFPGGLAEGDEETDPERTARREAREEVGLELGACLGTLSALPTLEPRRARPMRVVPVVFVAAAGAETACEPAEIAEAFWVPWSGVDAAVRTWTVRRVGRLPVVVPCTYVGGRLLWGLTLRMVQELRARLRAAG